MTDKKMVNFRLGKRDVDLIDALSEYHNCTKTDLIRRLILDEANNVRGKRTKTNASKRIEVCFAQTKIETLKAQLKAMEIVIKAQQQGII